MKNYMKNKNEEILIQRYADGELSPEEAKGAENLLSASTEAKREFNETKMVGDIIRNAMQDETSHVNFRGVWASINERLEKDRSSSAISRLIDYIAEVITPRKAVAALAGILAIVAGIVIFYEISLSPAHLEAAPTTVESIQYGDNINLVVAVETLEDDSTTVVWIDGIDINKIKENGPPNEI
jgi:anti-sigma factor RsiW